ncbi:MAG: class I SAM-dependent methyltransferase [bacterium]|nr:class I SAM-dependent methyltransferase [bacterium]
MTSLLRNTVRSSWLLLPEAQRKYVLENYWIPFKIRKLAAEADQASNPEQWYDVVKRFRPLHTEQKRPEIVSFLTQITALKPRYVCEIGTARGGTLFLLMRAAQSNAVILSVDPGTTPSRQKMFIAGKKQQQHVHLLREDSHAASTLTLVKQTLGGKLLDVLFIDGDHSYAGVKADFEMYSPLVRSGGIIGFHDIVPDYKARKGIQTEHKTGEVPQFWQEIKSQYQSQELIEDKEQDGYGIGILYWS